jgi:hypothetical protein
VDGRSGLLETLPLILGLFRCPELFQKLNTSPIYRNIAVRTARNDSKFATPTCIKVAFVFTYAAKSINEYSQETHSVALEIGMSFIPKA